MATYTLHFLDSSHAPIKFRSLAKATAAVNASQFACLLFDDADGRVIARSS